MAFIDTIPVAQATGEVRTLYEEQQAKLGYVPNYAKLFSQHPQVMTAWSQLVGSIRSTMDTRRYELITMAAARALHSSYCMLAHGTILQQQFLSPSQLTAIAEDFTTTDLAAAEVAMMAFAEQIARNATLISTADIQALRAHGFSDAEIFDLAATAAARCFFSKLLDALGAEPDAVYLQLDDELRRHLTVGRPISEQPLERVPVVPDPQR
jgi:uncharacterized peroxidase-related enzyme